MVCLMVTLLLLIDFFFLSSNFESSFMSANLAMTS